MCHTDFELLVINRQPTALTFLLLHDRSVQNKIQLIFDLLERADFVYIAENWVGNEGEGLTLPHISPHVIPSSISRSQGRRVISSSLTDSWPFQRLSFLSFNNIQYICILIGGKSELLDCSTMYAQFMNIQLSLHWTNLPENRSC